MTECLPLLAFSEVHKAPAKPGLYAWYGRMYASVADYGRDLDPQGRDMGEARLRALLARHMLRYQLWPFDLRGRGSFGADWRGSIEDRSRELTQELLLGKVSQDRELDEEARGFSKQFSTVMKEEKLRAVLVNILMEATPCLTAPIYIGVTKNLNKRLAQHVDLYRKLKDAIGSSEEKMELLREGIRQEGSEFAHRAVAMNFGPDHLWVAISDLDAFSNNQFADTQLREIAGIAEWLLNRWNRPFVGRR